MSIELNVFLTRVTSQVKTVLYSPLTLQRYSIKTGANSAILVVRTLTNRSTASHCTVYTPPASMKKLRMSQNNTILLMDSNSCNHQVYCVEVSMNDERQRPTNGRHLRRRPDSQAHSRTTCWLRQIYLVEDSLSHQDDLSTERAGLVSRSKMLVHQKVSFIVRHECLMKIWARRSRSHLRQVMATAIISITCQKRRIWWLLLYQLAILGNLPPLKSLTMQMEVIIWHLRDRLHQQHLMLWQIN